jgi:hypothetical protein
MSAGFGVAVGVGQSIARVTGVANGVATVSGVGHAFRLSGARSYAQVVGW